uniref:Uncharacterized protein n=1 Tax=Glossina brevipalpis TaxID=37001 RepID=A0A1A9WMJ7_9MUSC
MTDNYIALKFDFGHEYINLTMPLMLLTKTSNNWIIEFCFFMRPAFIFYIRKRRVAKLKQEVTQQGLMQCKESSATKRREATAAVPFDIETEKLVCKCRSIPMGFNNAEREEKTAAKHDY